jgi:hypothetical protein
MLGSPEGLPPSQDSARHKCGQGKGLGNAEPFPKDSFLSSMMHEESQEYDDRKGDADQPK